MNISFENVLGPHGHALSLRGARTTVLANNVANADTPGFKARDINFREVLQAAERGRPQTLVTTHREHLQPPTLDGQAGLMYRNPAMPSLDGNTVDAHVEQTEFAENNVQFLASLRFLDGRFKSMLAAIEGE